MTTTYKNANSNIIVNENTNSKQLLQNLILTTLLQSLKTGQTFIDSILSLVLVSEFKRTSYKYILIVGLLIFGNTIKNTNIVNTIIDYIKIHLNGINFTNLIPNEYLKKKISISNGVTFRITTINIGDNHYLQDNYNILAVLHRLIELNLDTSREKNYLKTEFICYDCDNPTKSTCDKFNINDTLSYEDYENHSKNKNYLTILGGVIRNPPVRNVWHMLDNKTRVKYSFKRIDTMKYLYEHILEIKSYNRNYDDILKYVNDCRVKMLNDIKKCEIEIKDALKVINDNIESKNFKGDLCELEIKKDGDKYYTYEMKKISSICRPIDTVFFEGKERLTNMMYNFKNNTGIYKKLPNKHKLGILIHGPPGGGKTSLSMAIATELRRNIIRVSIKDNKLNDVTLSHILSTYRKGYVIILDELDSHEAFRPRKPMIETSQEWEKIGSFDDDKKK